MAYKVEFDFQQGMRSLGRWSRRAYDKVKDMAEEETDESGREEVDESARKHQDKSER